MTHSLRRRPPLPALLVAGVLLAGQAPNAGPQPAQTSLRAASAASRAPTIELATHALAPGRGSIVSPGGVAGRSTPSPDSTASSETASSGTASSGTSAQAARTRARQAAKAVDQHLKHFRRYQRAAATQAQALSRAFALGAAADARLSAANERLRHERAKQAGLVKALYLDGEALSSLSLLAADDPQDALWRSVISPRVGGAALNQVGDSLLAAQDEADRAVRLGVEADRLSTQVATALGRMHDQMDAAQESLSLARAELTSLNATARRLEAAQRAAEQVAAAEAAAQAQTLDSGPTGALGIPASFVSQYQRAGSACVGLRWSLLAALGQVESGHGRNNGPSSAGAIGPMQFMPATFAMYGVDGDGDGEADPWNPADAIASAARYLCATGIDGSPEGDRAALFAYNRAQWYVDLVLRTEQAIIAAYPSSG